MKAARCAACGEPLESEDHWRVVLYEPGETMRTRTVEWSASLCTNCAMEVEEAAKDRIEEVGAWR